MRSAAVTINGAALRFMDAGDGAPIVAVHGALSDMRIWHPYRQLLPAESRFIAYTQRYFGPEPWPDSGDGFSREAHIADLIGFVEALEAGPVHLVTWSYGGDIGTYAMLRRADLFRSVVHFEPSVGVLLDDIPQGYRAQADFAAALEPAVTALYAGDKEEGAFRFAEAMSGLPPGSAVLQPEPIQSMFRDNARTLGPLLKMPPGAPIEPPQLTALETPTLIVSGQRTFTRYQLIAERLATHLPQASLTTMAGAGHDAPYRQPEQFARIIRQFHQRL